MGIVIRFPARRRHARASATSRAAKRVKSSAVTPARLALSVSSTADHHSEGMLLRLSHLRTAQEPAPTSVAISSREGHKSMIDRNEVKSDMGGIMGPAVPKIKAIVSHDNPLDLGHSVQMSQADENTNDLEWEERFRQRLKSARGKRTQDVMADLLCISRDAYSKYEGTRGTIMPVRLMPRFCKICAVSLEWLIEGDKKQAPVSKPSPARRRAANEGI